MRETTSPRPLGILVLAFMLVLGSTGELAARGGGRMGGGGGGFSRGGAARGGSLGGYSGAGRSAGSIDRSATRNRTSTRQSGNTRTSQPGDSRSNDGSFETRRGETVDWQTEVTRGQDGLQRDSSWESTSGASGSGSSNVRVKDGRVQGVDRSRQVESGTGETLNREVSSSRDGDWVVREGSIKTSTGINADTASAIRKTDDGYVAHAAVSGKDGAAAGTIVRDGDDVYVRGGKVQGDEVTWGRAHCNGGNCTGGRVTADIDDYYRHPYYYYPYYYGWYSCPMGSVQTWPGAYGTPVYGCSHVTVVQTTIALGPSASESLVPSASGSSSGASGSKQSTTQDSSSPSEARVTSAPVLMYEVDASVVVYSTDYEPEGVYSVKKEGRYYWAPGPKKGARDVEQWVDRASSMSAPTANATVITYTIGPRIVYLTNESPAPGFYAAPSDELFAWIPGVRDPNDAELAAIETAISAQRSGGRQALEREARKLEQDREPPPATTGT